MRPSNEPTVTSRRARRLAACAAACAAAWLAAPAARAIVTPQGAAYPVSSFEVEYALGHPRHIPVYEILELEVGLAGEPGLLTAPRPVDRTMRMRLDAPPQNMLFTADAIQHINRYIVSTFNRRGYNGVIVSVPDIEEGSGRDLRPPGVTALRLRIWTGRITRLSSFADDERFGGLTVEERTDMPQHAWIRARAPVQPGGVRAILDILSLEDYAAWLSRHPGRRVEAEISPGPHPGTSKVNLRIAEARPWRVYAEYSNTGTSSTTKNRQRFGFIDTQLTSRDDVLDLAYSTGDFDSVHAVYGGYEAPFSLDLPTLRGRARGLWSKYDSSEVGFTSLDFKGEEWLTEGALVWQAFQHRNAFIDLVGGARYHDISTEGHEAGDDDCSSGDGKAAFVVPHFGIEGERDSAWTSARASLGVDAGFTGASRCNLEKLGNINADSRFVLFTWGSHYSFFLEPLIDPAGWEDPETHTDSTLAHEIQLGFSGQYAFQRLVPEYQAIAGGLDTVRGAKQAELAADNLVLGRAEYRLHVPRLFSPDATPTELPWIGAFRTRPAHVFGLPDWDFIVSFFSDVAWTDYVDENATESEETLWSIGTGFELQVLRNLIVGVDVGHVLHGAERTDAGDTRTNVLATILY
jgi:hemolysin activation/secretion protein